MENEENVNLEQTEEVFTEPPVIEKISVAELKTEKEKIELEKPNFIDGLIDSMTNLSEDAAKIINKQLSRIDENLKKK